MIDLLKVRAAWDATPKFCRGAYVQGPLVGGQALCAISALVAFAGGDVRLGSSLCGAWYDLLSQHYGITPWQARAIIIQFDAAMSAVGGLLEVFAQLVRWNAGEEAVAAAIAAAEVREVVEERVEQWAPSVDLEEITNGTLWAAGL